MTSRNTAHPNVAFVVTEQGTSETVTRLKGQFAGLASSLQKNLTDVNSSLRDRMVATATDIDNHWKAQLAKIAPNLVRGNWSATREKTLLDISEITRALGDLKTAQTAIAMHDMSLAMNAGRLVSDLREASNLMSKMGRGSAGDSGGVISGLSGFQSGQQSAAAAAAQQLIAQESASKLALLRSGRFGAHDSGGVISGLSAYQASSGRSDRIRRAHELANNANIYAENELGDADFVAASQRKTAMLRRMAGPAGDHVVSGSQWEDQILGGVIRARAEGHAASYNPAGADFDRLRTQDAHRRQMGYSSLPNRPDFYPGNAGGNYGPPRPVISNEEVYANYRHSRYGEGDPRGPGFFGGHLTGAGSNRFRFAAQNVGFGVDDAIQSYQFGGVKASIRAASNNATAIAGMMIGNPVAAAASVIIISAVSAALPGIIDRFWAKEGATEAERLKVRQDAFERKSGSNAQFSDFQIKNALGQGDSSEYLKAFGEQVKTQGTSRDLTEQSVELAKEKATLEAERKRGYVARVRAKLDDADNAALTDEEVLTGNSHGKKTLLGSARLRTDMANMWSDEQTVDLADNKKASEANNKARHEQMAKQQDAERVTKRLELEVDAARTNNAKRRIDERHIEEANYRGEYSVPRDMEVASRGNAAKQIAAIQQNKNMTDLQKALAIETLSQGVKDKFSDPEVVERQNWLARNAAVHRAQRFGYEMSGDEGRVGTVTNRANDRLFALKNQHISGELSDADFQHREQTTQSVFRRERRRAVEDDIDDLNPEINPLKRMSRKLSRRVEELQLRAEAGNLSPEEVRQQSLAILNQGERDKTDFRPQGQHRFISHGYRVDSAEDAELEARATGNFGPVSHPGKHDSKTLQEILAAIVELNQNLQFEAQRLGT